MNPVEIEFDVTGVSPLSFSKAITTVKDTGEAHDSFEERTWRERIHVDELGGAFIPPNALKNMLAATARYLSESIPGKGKQTYTKNFEAGIMVVDRLTLNVKAKDIGLERLFVPSDGRPGGSRRVWKNFPILPTWETHGKLVVFDPILTAKPEKILEYLTYAGKFIGFLRFRPRNGGYYGRFEITNFTVNGKELN